MWFGIRKSTGFIGASSGPDAGCVGMPSDALVRSEQYVRTGTETIYLFC